MIAATTGQVRHTIEDLEVTDISGLYPRATTVTVEVEARYEISPYDAGDYWTPPSGGEVEVMAFRVLKVSEANAETGEWSDWSADQIRINQRGLNEAIEEWYADNRDDLHERCYDDAAGHAEAARDAAADDEDALEQLRRQVRG